MPVSTDTTELIVTIVSAAAGGGDSHLGPGQRRRAGQDPVVRSVVSTVTSSHTVGSIAFYDDNSLDIY